MKIGAPINYYYLNYVVFKGIQVKSANRLYNYYKQVTPIINE